jgi:hypothetical protein
VPGERVEHAQHEADLLEEPLEKYGVDVNATSVRDLVALHNALLDVVELRLADDEAGWV